MRVGFTEDASSLLNQLKQVFPLAERLRSFNAEHSLGTMTATNTAVAGALAELKASDGVVSTAVDVMNNSVRVGSLNPTDALEARLRARFGQAVRLVADSEGEPAESDARNYFPTPPYVGGVTIGKGGASLLDRIRPFCTSAFSVRRGNLYLMTAGHCYPRGAVPTRLTREAGKPKRGINIGTVSASETSGRLDAAQITIRRREASAYVLVQAGRGEVRQRIERQADSSDFFPGTVVCILGRHEEFARCNRILRDGFASTYNDGQSFRDFVVTTNVGPKETEIRGGDSGSPVIKDEKAFGILSGRNTSKDQTYCMPIANSSLAFKTFVVGLR